LHGLNKAILTENAKNFDGSFTAYNFDIFQNNTLKSTKSFEPSENILIEAEERKVIESAIPSTSLQKEYTQNDIDLDTEELIIKEAMRKFGNSSELFDYEDEVTNIPSSKEEEERVISLKGNENRSILLCQSSSFLKAKPSPTGARNKYSGNIDETSFIPKCDVRIMFKFHSF
jgi:hypothetical protein